MTTARAQDILNWLHQVFKEHEKSSTARDNKPVLLASSLAEREGWMSLLNEAFRSADGILVDAAACGNGVECGDIEADAPDLVNAVKALLSEYNCTNAAAELDLHIERRRAEVRGAASYDSVNAAQRAVREFATAMCDIRLRSSDLVCLVYAEDALDPSAVSLVWRSATTLLDHLGPRPETTLCLVAGDSRVNVSVHCAGERSLRFRVDNKQVQVRHAYATSLRKIEQFGRYSDEDAPLFVVFLGAGASAGLGLPLGDNLRDNALSGLMGTPVDSNTFEQVATAWFGELEADGKLKDYELASGARESVRTLTLERVLEREQEIEATENCTTIRRFAALHEGILKELQAKSAAGKLADDPIARLCALRRRLVLVTVNFDRFIEARAGANVRAYYTPAQMKRFPADLKKYLKNGGPVPLLKLHGDIEDTTTLVATIGETYAGLNESRQAAVRALIKYVKKQRIKPWWYVGYSMRDRDLEGIWTSAQFPTFNEHWVAPFQDPHVADFIAKHRSARWSERSHSRDWTAADRLISLTSDDFLQELASMAEAKWV